MLGTLADPILPIFAVLALGLLGGRYGGFDGEFARSLNRFVFYIGQPALIFLLLAEAPFAAYDLPALSLYFLSELVVYALGTLVAWRLFGRDLREALLLGMTCAFVNHLYYVLPIAQLIYGAEAAIPITGAIVVDVALLFCGTIFLMDLLDQGSASPAKILTMMGRNPALLALAAGVTGNLAGPLLPSGLLTFARFAGQAAAPVVLFALGVVMAGIDLKRIGALVWTLVAIKMLVHPTLAYGLFTGAAIAPGWSNILVLLAAGPCGAMPFVIALQYGVRTEAMTKAILISTFLTLISLAVLTS
jgi:predicted permease